MLQLLTELSTFVDKILGFLGYNPMKIAALSIVLCALCAISTSGCGREKATAPAERNELRLMTINVWSGLDYKGTLVMGEYEAGDVREKRYQALVHEIRRLSPDVIGINEANFLPDYIKRLAGDLGYDYLYHVGVSGLHVGRIGIPWNLKEGDAILAKKELRLQCTGRKQLSGGGFIWNNLSFHTDDATQVVLGKIRVNGEDVYVAVTHWHASPPDDAESKAGLASLKKEWDYPDDDYKNALLKLSSDSKWRNDESRDMAEYLKAKVPAGKKLIVLGDFNSEASSPEMKYLFSRGYIDSYSAASKDPGYTWDPEKNANIRKFYSADTKKRFDSLYEHLNTINSASRRSRIDFILFNSLFPGGAVKESAVCCSGLYDGVHPSDHFGVYSVLSLR